MGFFKSLFKKKPTQANRLGHSIKEAGNVFMMLFGAVGMVGVIGASTMTVMKGPVKTMSQVTQRTVAENNMIAAGKLALIAATTQASNGDCDGDGLIEPIPYDNTITGFTGGGTLPASIGVAKQDPWGNEYAYCVWDHGDSALSDATDNDANCGGSTNFRAGGDVVTEYTLAIISAGPDRNFDTNCVDFVASGTPLINKTAGADDLVLGYTYGEASTLAGGLWTVESGDPDTAEITKDLSVKSGAFEAFTLDAATGNLELGTGAKGKFPYVNTDNLQSFAGAGGTINVDSALAMGANNITTSGALAAGASTLGATSVLSLDANSGPILTTGTLSAGETTLSGDLLMGANDITTTGALNAGASTLGATGVSSLSSGSTVTAGTEVIVTGNNIRGGPGSDGIQFLENATNTSLAIKVGGLHLGGTYSGSAPTDGQIVTAGAVNMALNPGGVNAMLINATNQNISTAANFTIGGTLGATTMAGALAMGGNAITGLANPTVTDTDHATTVQYVNDAIAAATGSGAGNTETDPQVGDVTTAGKWCQTDGNSVECTFDLPGETDPQVGTLTNGRWCTTDGTTVDCTTPAPVGDNLGTHTASTDLNMATNAILNVVDPTNLQDAATKAYVDDVAINGVCTAGSGVWVSQSAAEQNTWVNSIYANGLFVAVSVNGTNRVMTSPDGITWTPNAGAIAGTWSGIAHDGSNFVVVGSSSVMTSPDGITWTAQSAASFVNWSDVTYGNGQFVAVSTSGTDRVMTSPDGITWTSQSAAEANPWHAITYGNGTFVALSASGANQVMTSPDGITWTAQSAAEANSWLSLAYGNGTFVAVANTGTNRVMTSPDGITWTAQSAAENNQWWEVKYANGQFISVARDGTNRVMTSPDGITWTAQAAAEQNFWTTVTYGNGKFVAISGGGTNRVMTLETGSCSGGANGAFALKDSDSDTQIQVEEGTDDDTIRFDTAGVERMIIADDGSVGIGTGISTVNAKLHVNGWALVDNGYGLRSKDESGTIANLVRTEASDQMVVGSGFWDSISFHTGMADRMYIDGATGNVGIGDTSPDGTLKLDVEGQVGSTGYCDENGTNCTTAAAIAAAVSGGDDLGDHSATQLLDMNGFVIRELADPTAAQHAATKAYVDAAVVAGADDLGNHIATTALNLAANKITNLGTPTAATDATTKSYVDAEISGLTDNDTLAALSCANGQVVKWNNTGGVWECAADASGSGGDDLGNHAATQLLDMNGFVIRELANPTQAQHAATKAYVDTGISTAIAAAPGDNLGNHTATTALNLATNKITNLGVPTLANDATTKTYVDTAVAAAADNLGNHTATTTLNMSSNAMAAVSRISFTAVTGGAPTK